MMILDLSTRKRKHPESRDYSVYPTPERSPKREESPTIYYHTYPNTSTEFLEYSNSSDSFTTSLAKLEPTETLSTVALSFTVGLDMENAMKSRTSNSQTKSVLSQVQARTEKTDLNIGSRPSIALPKYPLHLSSITYYTQFRDEVPPKVLLGDKNTTNENFIPSNSCSPTSPKPKTRPLKAHPKSPLHLSSGLVANKEKELPINSTSIHTQFRDKVYSKVEESHNISNENMSMIQLQSLKNEDSSCLGYNKKTNGAFKESTEASSLEYSKNGNSSAISVSFFPKLKTRPFKAFPKDLHSDLVIKNEVLPNVLTTSYTQFRDKVLSQVQVNHNVSNENMRRNQLKSSENEDPSYLEKRKKNNEAAKKSRDARKAKEDEIAIRCAFLEHENMELRNRVNSLDSYVRKLGICFRYT